MDFPYCEIGDVQAYNQHRSAYGTSTKPTAVEVEGFMDAIAARLRSACDEAGYDVDHFHAKSDTVALAITAGASVAVVVTAGTNFAVADSVLITGLSSGVRKWEVDVVKSVSGNNVTITAIGNNYDAASVTIYVLNDAMRTLRDLNALGAAAMAEEAAFGGVSPNKSEHAETLWERYQGSKDTRDGLWAIDNIKEFLRGATLTTEALHHGTSKSYGSEHEEDEDVDPVITNDMEF